MSDAAVTDRYAALRIPNFRRYLLALFTLTLAIQIQGTVVGWQIYDLTHDALALGIVGLAEALPAISMSLFAGHVADSHDRRRIAVSALVVLRRPLAISLSRHRRAFGRFMASLC